jgi:casein kinase 1
MNVNGGQAPAPQPPIQPAALAPGASRQDRRRSQGPGPIPPSPALVRNGSARRKIPTALSPGQQTPASGAAHVGVPAPGQGSMVDRRESQQRLSANHPFASVQGSYEFTREDGHEHNAPNAQYGRQSPMVSSAAPPEVNGAPAVGMRDGDHHQQQPQEQQSSFWKILTCKCG